ncbi:MAG: regulatory iron-sulfur-containing complex subunit RicT [Lentimicrobiaceae bacterium]|jgi:cell fate regulator YaaT (PSP1 superfamily)|nr:regulatory iron-sulfur-containing complex subunit RicT [Lentimicrobiaceae bacterium]MDD4598126.1 regulatory iron-sulfur-containing complex subunit RicT [Lentimicrobiaceae bacterium]MDY0026550.1 regulatory iron-sulfur-containing complex subunit RicT [Lentimicrobium sp.]
MEEPEKIAPEQNHFVSRGCCRQPSLIHKNDDIFRHSCSKLDAYDWLKHLPMPGNRVPFDCVEVRFKNNRKDFFRISPDTEVHVGDIVAVEANPGHDIGIVTLVGEIVRLQMKRKNVDHHKDSVRKLYRKARLSDIEKWITAVEKEDSTMFRSREIANGLNLKMKINDVEYQGDDTKAIFYYTADERVDFRELIKLLAENFKVRIEMRQIGARQEASRLGGIGTCGRELCCSTWLNNFSTVSTNAARIQQLSLNPQKLAGQCGKLKCCLNYEFSAYHEALKNFPPDDTVLQTKKGETFTHKIDVFARVIWFAYKSDPNVLMPIALDKVNEIIELNKKGKTVAKLEDYVQKQDKKPGYDTTIGQDELTRFDKKH